MTKKFIVLDTETAPTVKMDGDNVDAHKMRVYDLGYIVTDGKTIFEKRSFIIADTFCDTALMNSAYYADKMPQYRAGMSKDWEVVSFLAAYQQFIADMREYNVKDVWAFNMRFDRDALNATTKHYSVGFRSFFFPYGTQLHDIWDYAGSTICKTKKYVAWCFENNYTTKSGNPITNAQTIYRYLTANDDFVEAHTALQDCEIELFILQRARKRHQKARKSMGQGWRDAAKIARHLKK